MHIPVLLIETVEALSPFKKGVYVDCTVNRGGHSYELLEHLVKGSSLVCIDLDAYALSDAKEKLSDLAKEKGVAIYFVNDNFRNIEQILTSLSLEKVSGLIADLGISSQELDESERGFTFRFDEPLLMTMKSHPGEDDVTAQDVVNHWKEETLSSILYSFADEKYSRRIARNIVSQREQTPITTTFQLIEAVRRSLPKQALYGKTHFATKTFQAIRMAVNDELGAVSDLIDALPRILEKEAKAAVITFHSTEDRLVKTEVRAREDKLSFVQKKAILPSEKEIKNNARARSAQLRIIEVL